jgi:hypothetical protein
MRYIAENCVEITRGKSVREHKDAFAKPGPRLLTLFTRCTGEIVNSSRTYFSRWILYTMAAKWLISYNRGWWGWLLSTWTEIKAKFKSRLHLIPSSPLLPWQRLGNPSLAPPRRFPFFFHSRAKSFVARHWTRRNVNTTCLFRIVEPNTRIRPWSLGCIVSNSRRKDNGDQQVATD